MERVRHVGIEHDLATACPRRAIAARMRSTVSLGMPASAPP
jgi:hypothetical protein